MSSLDQRQEQLRLASAGAYSHFRQAREIWRRLRWSAYLRAERKRIHYDLNKHYAALVDLKARALKRTGVFMTEHEALEAAIVALAYALEDYRDGV